MSKFILADETTIVDVENVVWWQYHPSRDDTGTHLAIFAQPTPVILSGRRASTAWGWLLDHVENKPDV